MAGQARQASLAGQTNQAGKASKGGQAGEADSRQGSQAGRARQAGQARQTRMQGRPGKSDRPGTPGKLGTQGNKAQKHLFGTNVDVINGCISYGRRHERDSRVGGQLADAASRRGKQAGLGARQDTQDRQDISALGWCLRIRKWLDPDLDRKASN